MHKTLNANGLDGGRWFGTLSPISAIKGDMNGRYEENVAVGF
jgi:hypothetical protein